MEWAGVPKCKWTAYVSRGQVFEVGAWLCLELWDIWEPLSAKPTTVTRLLGVKMVTVFKTSSVCKCVSAHSLVQFFLFIWQWHLRAVTDGHVRPTILSGLHRSPKKEKELTGVLFSKEKKILVMTMKNIHGKSLEGLGFMLCGTAILGSVCAQLWMRTMLRCKPPPRACKLHSVSGEKGSL